MADRTHTFTFNSSDAIPDDVKDAIAYSFEDWVRSGFDGAYDGSMGDWIGMFDIELNSDPSHKNG